MFYTDSRIYRSNVFRIRLSNDFGLNLAASFITPYQYLFEKFGFYVWFVGKVVTCT